MLRTVVFFVSPKFMLPSSLPLIAAFLKLTLTFSSNEYITQFTCTSQYKYVTKTGINKSGEFVYRISSETPSLSFQIEEIFMIKNQYKPYCNSKSTSSIQHQHSSEQSDLWIIRTPISFLVEEGLAQNVPRGLVKLLQVELPAIRLQVLQDLLHRAEFSHGFAQSLHAVQSHGYDGGYVRLLCKPDSKHLRLGLFTKHILQQECFRLQIFQ